MVKYLRIRQKVVFQVNILDVYILRGTKKKESHEAKKEAEGKEKTPKNAEAVANEARQQVSSSFR